MDNESMRRRQVLAGVATAGGIALAGCSSLPWAEEDDSTPQFDRSAVESVLTTAVPSISQPEPVTPSAEAIADALARAEDLLETVPESIDAETVPNGAVRETIAERRANGATTRSDAAGLTESEDYRALRMTRDARESARSAATALEAIDADRDELLTALDAERTESLDALSDLREAIDYHGSDSDDGRLRAALLYADLEADLDAATSGVDRSTVDPNATVLDLGASAGDVEFAAATATVWDHLTDQYEADTPDRVELEPAFTSALDASIDRADGVSLPDQGEDDWLDELVDREVEQGFDQTVLWNAVRPVYDSRDRLTDAASSDQLGSGLRGALQFEQEYRAFEQVRDRFEADELTTPESTEPIITEREAAISAAEQAIDAIDGPSLAASLLADTVDSLDRIDDAIRRKSEGDPDHTVSLSEEYSEYIRHRARFDVHAAAVEAFRDRLVGAEGG